MPAGSSLQKLRQDGVGQLLAQLHTHLVEGIDVPDNALHENFVLVEGDEASEHARGEAVVHKGVGRTVARKNLVRGQCRPLFRRQGGQFRLGLFLGAAAHKRFGLGQKIGQ